jgi:hypothetical protein
MGCNLKPFEAIQRIRPPPGRGAARQPEASLAWETATSPVKRRQRTLKPCVLGSTRRWERRRHEQKIVDLTYERGLWTPQTCPPTDNGGPIWRGRKGERRCASSTTSSIWIGCLGAYRLTCRDAAPGIDSVPAVNYEVNLEATFWTSSRCWHEA